ncbi:MAG: hypothetical protein V1792_16195 [Pseudomonadota bacterium]
MATRVEISVTLKEKDSRLCNHALTGRAPLTKMCAHNYECGSCAYDQMLDDLVDIPHCRAERPRAITKAA